MFGISFNAFLNKKTIYFKIKKLYHTEKNMQIPSKLASPFPFAKNNF